MDMMMNTKETIMALMMIRTRDGYTDYDIIIIIDMILLLLY
jgi:hypothetical protein